jgi:hypothetical protein
LAFLILFVLCETALAIPASPFAIKTAQPDGMEIEIYRRGDERLNWVEDPKGYALARNEETGYWEYAILEVRSADVGGQVRHWLALIPSGVAYNPSENAPLGWPAGLRPTRASDRLRKYK